MKRSIFLFSIVIILMYTEKSYSDYYLGPYLSIAAGQMTHKSSSQQVYNNYIIGGGGIFQTSIHRKGLYNYRLNIGFEKVFMPHASYWGTDYRDTVRGNFINTISYSVYKKRNYDIWIGPSIGFHILWGNNYTSDRKSFLNGISLIGYSVLPYILTENINYGNFGHFIFSFAPEIGIDINPTDLLIVSLESGLRVGVHLPIYKSYSYGRLYRYEGFFNLSFLFRISKEENA